jgi:hypothetical protein
VDILLSEQELSFQNKAFLDVLNPKSFYLKVFVPTAIRIPSAASVGGDNCKSAAAAGDSLAFGKKPDQYQW